MVEVDTSKASSAAPALPERPTCLVTGTHECWLGLPIEACEMLRDRIVWLVRLRWWVVAMLFGAVGVGRLVFPAAAEWTALAAIVAALGALNALWQVRVQRGSRSLCRGVLTISTGQIVADFVLLTVAVHFTGGVAGPLTPLFVLHGVFSALLLRRWHATVVLVVAGVLLLATVALDQGSGWLPRWGFDDPGFRPSGLGGVVRMTFLGIAAIGATAIGLNLGRAGRVGHRRVAALARELEARNDELQRLDEQRVRLLGVASHDLRSPLAAVESRLDLFLAGYVGPLTDDQKAHLQKLKVRLGGLRAFVNDLLDFTAIQARAVPAAPEPVDVTAQLQFAVADFEALAAETGTRIHAELLAAPALVLAPPARLSQVWTNLLSNAVKYGGGRDVVACQALDDGQVVVRIIDQGIGIAPEDRARLFTDFFRGRAVRTSEIPGTGLGLAITKRVVDALGGSIEVDSEPGRGTTVTVRLPLAGGDRG